MRSNPKYLSISTKSLLEGRRKKQTAMKMNPDVASLTLISKDDPFSEWGSLQVNPEGNRQRQGLPCSGYKGRYAGKVKKGKLGRIITASTSSYKALPKLRMAVVVVGYAHSSDDVRRH